MNKTEKRNRYKQMNRYKQTSLLLKIFTENIIKSSKIVGGNCKHIKFECLLFIPNHFVTSTKT